jgi:hypothetical protein
MDEELKEIIKVNYNKAEDDISYNFLRFKYFDNIKKKKKKEKDAKSNLIKIMSASPFIILFLIIINIFGKKLRSREKEIKIKINNEIINLQRLNITKVNNNSTKAYEGNTIVYVYTIGKMENRYIREFVEHYKNYGINKIFLYDNNDMNGEKFEDVISDYINNSFVEIINIRGNSTPQFAFMNDCYHKNYDKYDWLIFYDVDEFIHLNNYTNVGKFLSEHKFEGCEVIYLNYVHHTDNNLLHYENRSLAERFPKKERRALYGGANPQIKPILRGHKPNITIDCLHRFSYDLINCNGYGNKNKAIDIRTKFPDYYNYYIIHYFSKSTEEFIEKIKRGDALKSNNYLRGQLRKYRSQSVFTPEKIKMLKEAFGNNLDIYN